MKSTYSRRYRRSPSKSRESAMFKKDSQQEHSFFAAPSHESFFKPNIAVNRKCDHCEAEDKKVKRLAGGKEEEKKVQKVEDKKEEVHRQAGPKEEEKKIQKVEDKKEEVHRQAEHKEEEKKVQKVEDKKEEVHRQAGPKEEEKKIQKVEDKKEEVHHQAGPKEEEKKIQKAEDKKEEVHRQAEHKEEEKTVSKKEGGATSSGMAATSSYIQSLNGKGNTLPTETLHFFGKKMGYDFSNVKIHTGIEAEKSAKDVNAKAYAVDNNIVFNKGQYNPGSAEGKKLLAHELTHVVQQKGDGKDLLNRVAENAAAGSHPVTSSGKATNSHNERAYGCEGVNIQGHTDANYADSFTAVGSATPSSRCTDDCADDCVVATGTIESVFQASPAVTLPSVPDGLTDCEADAVATFINTTLNNHEQKHVKAFNTYNGTVKTPYKFVGCQSNLDAYQQSLHDAINAKRQAAANAKSSKLDPFNPTIPCNCKQD